MAELRGTPKADTLRGEGGADTIYGSGGGDTLYGGGGDDTLYAGDGISTDGNLGVGGTSGEVGTTNLLHGEGGDDTLYGDAGRDTLDGGAGDDTLNGSTGDMLLGSDGADKLVPLGAGGQMILDGGAGDDIIGAMTGLGDGNQATGGTGADQFLILFNTKWSTKGVSVITDFNAAEGDRLSLGWGAPPRIFRGALDNANFSLKLGDTFSSHDYGSDLAQVWTWISGGDTYVIADMDGSRTLSDQDVVVRLAGQAKLDAAAFLDDTFSKSVGTDGADTFVGTNRDIHYFGLAGDDVIRAGNINSQLHGGPGNDQIKGSGGADLIWGGDGDDLIDGGGAPFGGNDFAMYFGASTDYLISRAADGALRVQDLKGSDGLDTVINVSRLQFTDRMLATGYGWGADVELAFKSVLRASGEAPSQLAAVLAISDWVTTYSSAFSINRQIVKAADATTSVASMAYQFFTGKIMGEAGIDYLVSPTGPNANNLNSAYYQSFNLENRYINFAVNLGKQGEGKDASWPSTDP